MKSISKINNILGFSFLLIIIASGARIEAAESDWTPLFDGKTLEGWTNPYEWGEAWVEDGEIRLRANKKFFLVYDEVFTDFIFEAEIKMPEGKANSGFMFRAHVEPNRVYGYQAEVDPSDRQWSGGLYDEGRRKWLHPAPKNPEAAAAFVEKTKGAFKADEWNKYRIECRGDRIQIFVNGVQTTDYQDSMDSSGYIAIQHHGEAGKVYRFRNLRLQKLGTSGFTLSQDPEKVIDTMGMPGPAGAITLLDQNNDLSHWGMEGNPDRAAQWPVEDGILTVDPGKGSLVTRQLVQDFAMHLEFRVPEEGNTNSGIYIQRRYEVQIEHSTREKPGSSASGAIYQQKAPDGENVARPRGEWQTYDMVFRAPRWDESGKKTENARISLRFNGHLVQNDYSITNKTGQGQPEGPSDGPIKLQDHGAKVQFRNIWMIPLDL